MPKAFPVLRLNMGDARNRARLAKLVKDGKRLHEFLKVYIDSQRGALNFGTDSGTGGK